MCYFITFVKNKYEKCINCYPVVILLEVLRLVVSTLSHSGQRLNKKNIKGTNKMEEPRNIINHLIAQDKLSEALDKLEEQGKNVSGLKGRLYRLRQQQIKGTISSADYNIEKNQLVENILGVSEKNTANENSKNTQRYSNPKPTYYETLKKKLENNPLVAWSLIIFFAVSAILGLIKNIPSTPIPKETEKNYIVIGQVVEDIPSNNPIDTVNISIQERPNLQIKSDATGAFVIALNSKIGAGFNFVFKHSLYKRKDSVISINSDTDTLFVGTIKLKPKPKDASPPPIKPSKPLPKKKKKTFAIQYSIMLGKELSQFMPTNQSIIDTLKYNLNKYNLDYSNSTPTYTIIVTTEKAPKEYYSGKFQFSGSQLKVLLNEEDCYTGTNQASMVPYIVPNSKGQFKKDYAKEIDSIILKNLPELLNSIKICLQTH